MECRCCAGHSSREGTGPRLVVTDLDGSPGGSETHQVTSIDLESIGFESISLEAIGLESSRRESRAQVFAALSDPIRLHILDLLDAVERCVCDLQEQIDAAPNLLSYHLRVLRDVGLVESSRRGRWVDYRLASDARDIVDAMLPRAMRSGAQP